MFSLFSKKVLIYVGLIAVAGVSVFFFVNGGNGKQTVTVLRADIAQEVASTGKVKPNQDVNLGFDKSGRVERVYVSVGDLVKKGDIIASLESGDILADLNKAKASLQEENIKLREMKSTTPITYGDASKNLDAAIREGFSDADNAVRNRADQFFKNVKTSPRFEISIVSGNFVHYFKIPDELAIEIGNERRKVEVVLNEWQNRNLSMSSSNLISSADEAIKDLNLISSFLNKVASAINTFSPAEYDYETTVSNYKTTISSARSEVSGAISSIVTAKDKLNVAPTLGEGGQFESVLAQEARVRQAEAEVSSLESSLSKSLIISPFDGVVSLQEAKTGAAVSVGSTLVSVISQNQMYIEANISEIHIGKISAGNPVSISFDAFPGEEFSGELSYIEPSDVIVEGIVNYKIRVTINELDPRIKSGLTANLKIQTVKKENVLSLPLYTVFKENGQSFVNKVVGKEIQKTPVTLGLSGGNGLVEILSGINEGDVVEF